MSPTWETASDWDSAASEDNVVHESVANTDHDDATIVKQGYAAASPYLSADLELYVPFDEDSGSTAFDFSGNNNDGSVSGATVNVDGLLGATGYDFDGTDDAVTFGTIPNIGGSATRTVVAWIIIDDSNNQNTIFNAGPNTSSERWTCTTDSSGSPRIEISGSGDTFSGLSMSTGTLHMIAYRNTGSTLADCEVWLDGSVDTGSSSTTLNTDNATDVAVGNLPSKSGYHFDGRIFGVWVYSAALSDSQLSEMRSVVTGQGSLITAEKLL